MENKFYQNLKKWTHENGATLKFQKYGTPDYFGDNFFIPGILIDVSYSANTYDDKKKINELEKKIKRNKNYIIGYRGGKYCYWIVIFEKSDFIAYQEHENRVKAANDNFNEWYHDLVTKYGAHSISA
jgi:hypothetical protein